MSSTKQEFDAAVLADVTSGAQARTPTFSWTGITCSAAVKGKSRKNILKGIDGTLVNGQLCAIIGPSGSGKTTLLNVLAGRLRTKGKDIQVGGQRLYNGCVLSQSRLRKVVAYVVQEDLLVPTQTPREAMRFSATLRLPRSTTNSEKRQLVDRMIADLKLSSSADTLIGDELIRGISGGEKKRTAVGIELVMQPKLLFLDEPTSGLDSYAAFNVVKTLKGLADQGCNVLCTIHQPSSEIFHTFDKLLLLHAGTALYSGPVRSLSAELSAYAVSMDAPRFACPPDYNIADHILFLIQTEEEHTLADLQQTLYKVSHHKSAEEFTQSETSLSKTDDSAVSPAAGFFTQLGELSRREFIGVWRNKPGLIALVVAPLLLNLLFALIFYQAGSWDSGYGEYDITSHFGAMTQIAIGGMFGAAQPLLLKFPLERGIFLREYATSTYGGPAYFLSKMMVELPQGLVTSTTTWLVSYWLIGLHGSFVYYVFIFWASGIAAGSTALFIGSIAKNPEVATQAAPAIFVPQLLFAGFFIKSQQIPVWLRWAQWLCSLKYTMSLFILNEFGTQSMEGWPAKYQAQAKFLIEANDVDPDQWWFYLLVLIAIPVFFRLLSIVVLSRRAATAF
mmetsp:Transcript_16907/g.28132  ORF Transcript_16907/g.28132 Transcript_16907/m.28132 type:complete len:618 (+) Transcript_16907:264-2117(+)